VEFVIKDARRLTPSGLVVPERVVAEVARGRRATGQKSSSRGRSEGFHSGLQG
jgi:hypothetical protein